MTKETDIIFHHHLGLGDHFICNGMVNYFSEMLNCNIHLPCREKYYKTVSSLYSMSPNINVMPMKMTRSGAPYDLGVKEVNELSVEKNWRIIRVGFHGNFYYTTIYPDYPLCAINVDRQFYEQCNIPFSIRYKKVKIPSLESSKKMYKSIISDKEEYILIHRNSSATSKYPINLNSNIKIVDVTPDLTDNLLDYVDLIINAKEIHCVNSSFFCLVDSLFSKTKAKLVYHNIRKNVIFQVNSWYNDNRWQFIDYPTKV